MCFKTASLPAPASQEVKVHHTTVDYARITVQATGVREVRIGFGSDLSKTIGEGATTQRFTVRGLRETAAYFTKLADDLEA